MESTTVSRIQYWQYDWQLKIEQEYGIPAQQLELPARLRERARLFPVKDIFYVSGSREDPPPWGGKPGMWFLLKSDEAGQYKSLAGEMKFLRSDLLGVTAALYYVMDATGQKISRAVAGRIAADMDFDHRSMHTEEMIELYQRHAEFSFS